MANKKNPRAETEVDSYIHEGVKRRNIPTAENQGLVPDDDKAVKLLRYPRNPDLDPQLVWKGKDEEDGKSLEVQAPPIYIQEKIHPQALIDNLRKQSAARKPKAEAAAQIDWFHDFNGLADPKAKTEFYAHDQNWQNRMILGDSLQVMGSLAEREALRGKVQCIYFDPPYGIKFNSNWQPSVGSKDVKETQEFVSREPEVVRAFRDTWKNGINSYLSYIRDRAAVARDLLTTSGSFFAQIGEENVHIVRVILDEIFGAGNFVGQIWFRKKTMPLGAKHLERMGDYILWYSKNVDTIKFRRLFRQIDISGDFHWSWRQQLDGSRDKYSAEILAKNPDGDPARLVSMWPASFSAKDVFELPFRGRKWSPPTGQCWPSSIEKLDRLAKANRLEIEGSYLRYVMRLSDDDTTKLNSTWHDTTGARDQKYIVETSPLVVQRCLLMASDPGDLVLDPTCGSGTTAYVAEQLGRRWITIDTSRVALTLARARLMGAKFDFFQLKDSKEGAEAEAKLTGKPPAQGPFGNDIRHGFVYARAPQVALKNIANNLAIDDIWERFQAQLEPLRAKLNAALKQKWEEWQIPREAVKDWPAEAATAHAAWWKLRRESQAEIDASIARNADVEFLYDKPEKAKGTVRVSGPFTVESLSPHRVLPLGEDPYLAEQMAAEQEAEPEVEQHGTSDFAQVVFDNLMASGVQNTKKGETLKFEWLKPRVSRSGLVPFEGRYMEGGEVKRAAVCIGPEYDTVGYDLVKRAAREAADLYDTLIVCGFAFSPEVDETRLNFGSLTVLKARMNQDLRMGDKLKATGAGNLFVIFGEPDLRVEDAGDGMLRVEIKGLDIFDPTTGEVRSSGGSDLKNDVAAWFIDDDYNEESFFVRQAYFVGQDPYDSLKRALKAEIDEEAWGEMNATISRPFPKPASGRICVKVINHFGDEVQKVFEV